jgi:predicted transcriptional regulator
VTCNSHKIFIVLSELILIMYHVSTNSYTSYIFYAIYDLDYALAVALVES